MRTDFWAKSAFFLAAFAVIDRYHDMVPHFPIFSSDYWLGLLIAHIAAIPTIVCALALGLLAKKNNPQGRDNG